MTDDKGAGGEMQAQAGICKHCLDDHEGDDCVGYARSQGYIAGRKAERERCADICEQNATCEGIAQKIKAHILGGQDGE